MECVAGKHPWKHPFAPLETFQAYLDNTLGDDLNMYYNFLDPSNGSRQWEKQFPCVEAGSVGGTCVKSLAIIDDVFTTMRLDQIPASVGPCTISYRIAVSTESTATKRDLVSILDLPGPTWGASSSLMVREAVSVSLPDPPFGVAAGTLDTASSAFGWKPLPGEYVGVQYPRKTSVYSIKFWATDPFASRGCSFRVHTSNDGLSYFPVGVDVEFILTPACMFCMQNH